MKNLWFFVTTLIFCVIIAGCNKSDDNPVIDGRPGTLYDISGTWSMSLMVHEYHSGTCNFCLALLTKTASITQSGNDATLNFTGTGSNTGGTFCGLTPAISTISATGGTYVGSTLGPSFTLTETPNGGFSRAMTLSGTTSTLSGLQTWSFSSGTESCYGSNYVVASKQ